ncbi:hypothetical protein [Desulfurococcus sp.]|uniref:hypothetical protein n=1 Tax=Desulfurococcus sp. TaxID=51678 RepID=UPI00319E325D
MLHYETPFIITRKLVDSIMSIPATMGLAVGNTCTIIGASTIATRELASSINDSGCALIADGTTLFLT